MHRIQTKLFNKTSDDRKMAFLRSTVKCCATFMISVLLVTVSLPCQKLYQVKVTSKGCKIERYSAFIVLSHVVALTIL